MNLIAFLLIGVLALWMLACAMCGYYKRPLRFLGVVLIGVALNLLWMLTWMKAGPLDPNAIMAQMALLLYGLSAFGCGWLAGRTVRQWRASRVEDSGV